MKILVLRFSSIGDIVLTTPVVRCLKKQLDAEVHFLTKAAFAPILAANPHVDRVFSFQKEVTEVLPDLKNEGYDFVVDLHHNLRSLRVKLVLGRPARSFDKLNFEKWLLVRMGIDRLPDVHIVQRYMATVESLGVKYDGAGLDFFILPDQEFNLKNALITHNSLLIVPPVAFVIGATHATKRLPTAKIIETCRLIRRPVVLLGGKAEAAAGKEIASQAGSHVLDLCGRLSLMQSASVVRQAEIVVTHDTGLMHIAAAFGKKIVSIWGNTVPKFGMYPFYPDGVALNQSIEIQGLACRPCSKIGHDRCPRGHFRCMNDIDPAQIARAVDDGRKTVDG
ncbi:MAG: glycosyltransferase family 9 protein [Saprospiraceae bacterium]